MTWDDLAEILVDCDDPELASTLAAELGAQIEAEEAEWSNLLLSVLSESLTSGRPDYAASTLNVAMECLKVGELDKNLFDGVVDESSRCPQYTTGFVMAVRKILPTATLPQPLR